MALRLTGQEFRELMGPNGDQTRATRRSKIPKRGLL